MNLPSALIASLILLVLTSAWVAFCIAESFHPLTPPIEKPPYHFFAFAGMAIGSLLNTLPWRAFNEVHEATQ